jgi:hypothetical protein
VHCEKRNAAEPVDSFAHTVRRARHSEGCHRVLPPSRITTEHTASPRPTAPPAF